MGDPRVEYVLGVLLGDTAERFQWPAWLAYGDRPPNVAGPAVQIVPSSFFGDGYGAIDSLPSLPLDQIEGVPLLFGVPVLKRRGEVLVVGADILASAYFLLTRYEEWVRRDVRDVHGRFPGRESLAFRAGFMERPIVDEYAALLRAWAGAVGVGLLEQKRRFSVLLTHDVDYIGPETGLLPGISTLGRGLLDRRRIRRVVADSVIAAGLRRHPDDNLEAVLRLDGQLTERVSSDRCRTIFMFNAGVGSQHYGTSILGSRRTAARLRWASRSGAEIALHASYEAGGEPHRLGQERRALEEVSGLPIDKSRHHFLRWLEPEDGAALATAGIRWDATLGYADVAGFRLGVCRPVPLFDPMHRRLMGVEEHPLIVMDRTLDRPECMGLDEDAAFEYVRNLADTTFRHQGEFVCLWHNDALASGELSYHKRLYPRALDHLGALLDVDPVPVAPRER